MKSYDLLIHKEIIRILRAVNINVTDNSLGEVTPIVVLADSDETPDDTKTFERNKISYTIKMWGSKDGSSLEIKQLKAKVVQALTESDYSISGYSIDNISVESLATFKELENTNSSKGYAHYYQSILNIVFQIKEEKVNEWS